MNTFVTLLIMYDMLLNLGIRRSTHYYFCNLAMSIVFCVQKGPLGSPQVMVRWYPVVSTLFWLLMTQRVSSRIDVHMIVNWVSIEYNFAFHEP